MAEIETQLAIKPTPPFVQQLAKKLRRLESSRYFPWALLTPVLLFFLIWNIIPLLWLLGLSFYNYQPLMGRPASFVGLGNYSDMFTLEPIGVWSAFGRTFVWMLMTVGVETVFGVLLGLLFWRSTALRGRRLALALMFTPMLAAPVSVGAFMALIYHPTLGVSNYVLQQIIGTKIDFLGTPGLAMPAVAAVDWWMWTPFMMLITLAALGSVPKAELEAAEVDRLSWWQRMRHVVLPHGKYILMLGIILRTIDSYKTTDLVFQMTYGGPGNETELASIMLWRKAFDSMNMGWSSSLAVLLLLTAIAFTSVYLYILNLGRQGR
jgi:multiple sugar transport system permease protein